MNERQRLFLERLAQRIPVLFEAIRQGNHRSEFILGNQTIESRRVRLKLVAEVIDSGINPLATHSASSPDATSSNGSENRDEPVELTPLDDPPGD